MNRRIVNFFLLLIFSINTIGIPITLHYCKMMDLVSFKPCEMCNSNYSCCTNKDFDVNIKFRNENSCCQEKIISTFSTEEYLIISNEIQKIEISEFVFVIPIKHFYCDKLFQSSIIISISPPLQNSIDLFLDNSILLI